MENYPITVTMDEMVHHFEVGEYLHNEDGQCKYRVFENGTYVASFTPDAHEFLQICQNPGSIQEEVLHLLADQIEAHHPQGINDKMDEREKIYQEFKQVVNMTASVLAKWLKTEESKSVGWDSGDGESIGHKSGENIIRILHKKKAELTDADYQHMQKVHTYVERHMAQKPEHPKDSNWDYSLKNWGHDYAG